MDNSTGVLNMEGGNVTFNKNPLSLPLGKGDIPTGVYVKGRVGV